jgi:peptide/nickel transport system substrate-binding protein
MLDDVLDSELPSGPRRRRAGLRFLAATAVLVTACVAVEAAASGGVTAKPTLTIAGLSACDGSNVGPLTGNADPRLDSVYQSLISLKNNGSFGPSLAAAWSVKPGNKVITLTLRHGIRFSDGEPLNASAVKTWLDYRASISNNASSRMGPVRSVDVLSPYVVRMTLKSPNPDVVRALSSEAGTDWGHVTAPNAIAQVKANPNSQIFTQGSFGAGPYVLVPSQTVIGDHCTYVPNKFYYDKSKIKWSKIVWKQIVDPNATLAALKTGQVDVAYSQDFRIAKAVSQAGLRVVTIPNINYVMYFYDLSGNLYPAEADLRVRQAMNYALDRKTITKAFCGPGATPTSLAYAVQLSGKTPARYANYYPYNPAKAKALLAAAGYKNGFEIKIVTTNAWAGGGNLEPVAAAVAQSFAAVGIKMDVIAPDTPGQWIGELFSGKNAGFQFLTGAGSAWTYFGIHFRPGTKDPGLSDQHGWSDPVLTKLWLKGQRLPAKQAELVWQQFNERLVTQAYTVPLCRTNNFAYASTRVGGFAAGSGSYSYTPIVDWYPTNG